MIGLAAAGLVLAVIAGGGMLMKSDKEIGGTQPAAFESEPVHLMPEEAYEGFEGWGTSLAWWANVLGGWKDKQKENEVMDLLFDPDRGLGLTIVRYNIGGGENPELKELRPGATYPVFSRKRGGGTGRPTPTSDRCCRER